MKSMYEPLFKQLKNDFLVLESSVDSEMSASDYYIDVDKMQPELKALMKEIQSSMEDVEKMKKETDHKLDSSSDPSLELPTVIAFNDTIKTSSTLSMDLKSRLDSILTKYKNTPAAVLARKTKRQALMERKAKGTKMHH